MPTFTYEARKNTDRVLTGQIEAPGRPEAITKLRAMGYHLLNVSEAEGSLAESPLGRLTGRIGGHHVAIFTGELSTLLRAGIPLVAALRTLIQQTEDARLTRVIESVCRNIEESASLSEALAAHPKVFSPAYTAAVRAGEEGGLLAEVLARLATHLKHQQEIRGRIRSALAYPVFVTCVGAVAITVLLVFVIPRFMTMFVTMADHLPWPTRLLLAFSKAMNTYWPVVPAAVAATLLIAWVARTRQSTRKALDAAILKVPLVGPVVLKSQLAAFARTLGELLHAGVPILRATQVTQGVVTNRILAQEINAARDEIVRGQSVSASLAKQPHFSPLIVNMTAIGEESGQLPEMLAEVADMYEEHCHRAIDSLTSLIGPGLIVILGGIIGFVVTAILLPVFQAGALAE